jgi:hypothetical protein
MKLHSLVKFLLGNEDSFLSDMLEGLICKRFGLLIPIPESHMVFGKGNLLTTVTANNSVSKWSIFPHAFRIGCFSIENQTSYYVFFA